MVGGVLNQIQDDREVVIAYATLLEGPTADLPLAGSDLNLIAASRQDTNWTTYEWVQSRVARGPNVRDYH